MDKIILHLDMDAFFASIEQAVNPALRGKPVIVGSRATLRSTVVAAASYEAKAYGVASGMSAHQAYRLCPHAVFIPADSVKYAYTSEEIFTLLKGYAPNVEMASVDEFYMDATLYKEYRRIARVAAEIKERIHKKFHITGSVGVAPNRIIAKMASKASKPDGLLMLPKEAIPNFLEALPVEKVPGIGPYTGACLATLGIMTCGQLRRVKKSILTKRYGKIGEWLHAIAQGEDSDIVSLYADKKVPPKSVGHSYTLARTIYRIDSIRAWIRLLSEMVAVRLRRYSLEAKTVHCYMRQDASLAWIGRQKNFSSYTLNGNDIYLRCLCILKLHGLSGIPSVPHSGIGCGLKTFGPKRYAVRAIGISASGLRKAQKNYLFEEDKKKQDLMDALDSVNGHFGEWTVYPAVLSLTK